VAGKAGIEADVKIETMDQWQEFRAKDLDTIVDSMVFRAGDIFLRGRQVACQTLTKDAKTIWDALSRDIGSVQGFFDQIILADRLPLIDYGITYDSALNYPTYDSPRVCKVVNEVLDDQVVHTVHVSGDPSKRARESALEAMVTRRRQRPNSSRRSRTRWTRWVSDGVPTLVTFSSDFRVSPRTISNSPALSMAAWYSAPSAR
jgi:hypothetical protein